MLDRRIDRLDEIEPGDPVQIDGADRLAEHEPGLGDVDVQLLLVGLAQPVHGHRDGRLGVTREQAQGFLSLRPRARPVLEREQTGSRIRQFVVLVVAQGNGPGLERRRTGFGRSRDLSDPEFGRGGAGNAEAQKERRQAPTERKRECHQ